MRLVGHQQTAEDAVQEAYTRAFNALQNGQYDERSKIESWLVSIVTRVALDMLRQQKRQTAIDFSISPDHVPSSDAPDSQAAAIVELTRWLSELAPDQKAAVVLFYLEDLTCGEVAEILGVSEGAIEQRLLRARAVLRKKFQDDP